MPTPIGLIFIAVGLYCFFRKPAYLFPLVLFSTIFPTTSALNFGSLWIMPYYVIAPMFIVSQVLRGGISRRFSGSIGLVAFIGVAVFSAIVFPLIFAGTQVYSPRLGSSDLVFQTFPLVFSVANVAQAGYLAVNMLVVFAAASSLKADTVWLGVTAAFYCMMGVIAAQLACISAGIAFPYSIIENNPDRASLENQVLDATARVHGTTGEPSYTGLVLVAFFAAYFYRSYTAGKDGWKAAISAAALFFVRSSTSLVALALVVVLVILFNLPFRAPSVRSAPFLRMRQLLRLLIIVFAIGASFTSSTVRELIQQWIIEKPETGSFDHRTTMDKYSVQLIESTYGIGVGVGSYRPSSLIASLLGNVGFLGISLFAFTFFAITRNVPPDKAWLRWSLLAALLDMAIAIPDITEPFLWGITALVVYNSVSNKTYGYSAAMPLYGAHSFSRHRIARSVDL